MWIDSVNWVLTGVAALVLLPLGILLGQIVLAQPSWRARPAPPGPRPRACVLVPAHNEAGGIVSTLQSILAQCAPGDRVVVVADNCSDDTAKLAAAAGAEVIERSDLVRRGKGYALDFGIRHLDAEAPEVVLIVDADCLLGPGAIDRLVRECAASGRPVQALYLMHAPEGAGLKTRVAEFAWTVRNHLRPLGFHRLGLPCQLMGTGMAFPWAAIRGADLANGHIVEDLKLGLELARRGLAPRFCPDALVTSTFPVSADGMQTQRTRWEHGHLSLLLGQGLPMMGEGLLRADVRRLALALDLCVPPLALLALLVAGAGALGAVWWAITGALGPLTLALIALALLAAAILLAWRVGGRHILSLRELAYAPLYVLRKVPLYLKFVVGRQVEWVRSRRD